MGRPIVSDEVSLGAKGVRIVDAIVHDKLGWLFRPLDRVDLGIDGEIELVDQLDDKRRGTGRLIAAQIKCGTSFFKEEDGDSYVFRGAQKHLEYWSDFSLPVLIIICHPVTEEAYWVEFSQSAVVVLDAGWKTLIPKANKLSNAGAALGRVALRNHLDNVINLNVQAWMHASRAERVAFCGSYELPRDFHWYHHLAKVGEEIVMVHWLYARYGRFEIAELKDVLRYLPGNLVYSERLFLCLVSETADAFNLGDDWREALANENAVTVVKLILDQDWASVGELAEDGLVNREYHNGEPVYRETIDGQLAW